MLVSGVNISAFNSPVGSQPVACGRFVCVSFQAGKPNALGFFTSGLKTLAAVYALAEGELERGRGRRGTGEGGEPSGGTGTPSPSLPWVLHVSAQL